MSNGLSSYFLQTVCLCGAPIDLNSSPQLPNGMHCCERCSQRAKDEGGPVKSQDADVHKPPEEKIHLLEAEIARRIINEASAALRMQRLEDLYRSACTISEQRRKELAALKGLLPEIKEAIEYAIECADGEAEDLEQPEDYRRARERSLRYVALYRKLAGEPEVQG